MGALLGTSGDVENLEGDLGDHLDESSRVEAVCDMWGPTDFLQMGGRHNEPKSPESQLIGGPIQEDKQKVARANPITYVTKDDPPFLLIHGGRGFPVEKMNDMVLAFFEKALKQHGRARNTDYFTSLFDDERLDGWVVRTGQATYTVEEGVIVGRTATEGPNTFLCTKRDYGNFELTLDVKCDPGLNSGIQIRSHAYETDTPQPSNPKRIRPAGTVYGYQVEISANGSAGRIWDEARYTLWLDQEPSEETKKAYRPGHWNRYRIVALGDRIRTWINGTPAADIRDGKDVNGFIGLQVHRIRQGAGPFEVRWKNIQLRELNVNPDINKSFEDPSAAAFVERWEKEGREIYDRRHEIVKACGIRPGNDVADIGAGTGLFSRLFAAAVGSEGRIFAVDIAENFVDHIERECREEGLTNVTGIVCNQDDVKLPPESIDLAFLCDTYHHFEYPYRTMASIHRALRLGGRLVVIDFVREEGVSSKWILGHVRAGQATVTKEIQASGFSLLEEKQLLQDNYFLEFVKN